MANYVFDRDVWVSAIEVLPGNPAVVHHATALALYPEDMRGGMPPLENLPGRALASIGAGGENISQYPKGYAKPIPKGSRVYFEIHYVPNGLPTHDQMSIGFVFEKNPKSQVISIPIVNMEFVIPPRAANHEVTASFKFPVNGTIIAAGPHMHVRGKDFKYELTHPNGKTELLLSVPRWNFHSPMNYKFAEPIPVERGTLVSCVGHFDNSQGNRSNPNPNDEVIWGQQSSDEMFIGWIDVAYDLPIGSPRLKVLNPSMGRFFSL